MLRHNFHFLVLIGVMLLFLPALISHAQTPATPGWHGQVLIDGESTTNWSLEQDAGATGNLKNHAGFVGQAVEFNWNLGSAQWIQAKYTFPQPVDLARKDLFGISIKGSASKRNRVSFMFTDVNGVFFGLDCDGLNQIDRWVKNLPFPKKAFYHFFTIGPDPYRKQIDWSQIDRFFVVVKRPPSDPGGGSGQLWIDHCQADRAADWPRPTTFETITPDSVAANRAVNYLLWQQMASGLFRSWKEEAEPRAYLYDQALTLIVLTRVGKWENGIPVNPAAQKAQKLVQFLTSHQKGDGHWGRAWNPASGVELTDDRWVGDQAWWMIALSEYLQKANAADARHALEKGAQWLEIQVHADGSVVPSTEGTVDTWWALIALSRFELANRIQNYLLTKVWDPDLKYWWRGLADYPDPGIAMDAATWVGEFAKSVYVKQPERSLAALGFVRRTLITTDDTDTWCGLDGQGPLSIWCEGTAQYISAGGENATDFLNMLLSLQRADGGMPCSPDNWPNDPFGWLSDWTGLAPTAWLYFALTRSPFPQPEITTIAAASRSAAVAANNKKLAIFPNPFNTATNIEFQLTAPAKIELVIYDLHGRKMTVLTPRLFEAGTHRLTWNGAGATARPVPSGLYLLQFKSPEITVTRKLIIIR